MAKHAGHPHGFSPPEIEAAVAPMLLQPLPASAYLLLARYLDLLTRWNQKINLTAVREPDVLVRLHIAECLRAAQRVPAEVETVLDLGSGAGLPGLPIQIARPESRVTLAESQNKKAAFLREAVRELGLSRASIHSGRVEEMPQATVFDLVTLRAVDKMQDALHAALPHLRFQRGMPGGKCMVLTSQPEVDRVIAPSLPQSSPPVTMEWLPAEPIPTTTRRVIVIGRRIR